MAEVQVLQEQTPAKVSNHFRIALEPQPIPGALTSQAIRGL
jgi:hypothetical protein